MTRAAIAAVVRLAGGDFLHEPAMVADHRRLRPHAVLPLRAGPRQLHHHRGREIVTYSDDVEVFRFDLCRATAIRPEERRAAGAARRTGTVAGVLQWLRLQLDDTEIGSRTARPTRSHASAWRQVFYPFRRPLKVAPGRDGGRGLAAHDCG